MLLLITRLKNEQLHHILPQIHFWYLKEFRIGLPSKSRSEKIPRNRLGTVFVIIPRKKVLLSQNSVCLGIAPS
jgi:hypothetical protein